MQPSLKAATQDILKHKGLAYRIASGHGKDKIMPYEDRKQTAIEGLLRAQAKFDPDRGFAFATYAWPVVKTVITQELRNYRTGCILPVQADAVMRTVQHLILNSIEPTVVAVRKVLKSYLKDETIEAIIRLALNAPLALDYGHGSCGRVESDVASTVRHETVPSKKAHSYPDEIGTRSLVSRMLGSLKPKEQFVLIGRFGLFGVRQHTTEEMSEKLEVSKQRVAQLWEAAINQLRHRYTDMLARGEHNLNFEVEQNHGQRQKQKVMRVRSIDTSAGA